MKADVIVAAGCASMDRAAVIYLGIHYEILNLETNYDLLF
jgi:hypothetical protein